MKTIFLNKRFTGLVVVKTVCLFILMIVTLTSSLTAFAAVGCQGANKPQGNTAPQPTKTLMVAPNMACTTVWPPLLKSDGTSLTVDGLSCKLTVTQNDNGQQITCNGHLLYTYAKDPVLIATGDNKGNGTWHVATPDNLTTKPSMPSTTSQSPAPNPEAPATSTPMVSSTPKATSTPAAPPSTINIK